jgi:hypothetical protein
MPPRYPTTQKELDDWETAKKFIDIRLQGGQYDPRINYEFYWQVMFWKTMGFMTVNMSSDKAFRQAQFLQLKALKRLEETVVSEHTDNEFYYLMNRYMDELAHNYMVLTANICPSNITGQDLLVATINGAISIGIPMTPEREALFKEHITRPCSRHERLNGRNIRVVTSDFLFHSPG